MSGFHQLRHRIAERLYAPTPDRPAWAELTREAQKPWLDDASIAIVLTIIECVEVAEENWFEAVVPHLKGIHVGDPNADPMPCRAVSA